jgi:hypothetical protein
MNTDSLSARIAAACGALAITMTLFVSSFANPAATTVAGILA